MKAIKCDRCGKEYTENKGVVTHFEPLQSDYKGGILANSVVGITIRYGQVLSNGKTCTGAILTPDLCDECIAGLVKYLEAK